MELSSPRVRFNANWWAKLLFFSKQKRPTDLEYSSSILSTTEVSPSSGGGMIIISHAELLSASQSLLFCTQAKCVVVAYNLQQKTLLGVPSQLGTCVWVNLNWIFPFLTCVPLYSTRHVCISNNCTLSTWIPFYWSSGNGFVLRGENVHCSSMEKSIQFSFKLNSLSSPIHLYTHARQ